MVTLTGQLTRQWPSWQFNEKLKQSVKVVGSTELCSLDPGRARAEFVVNSFGIQNTRATNRFELGIRVNILKLDAQIYSLCKSSCLTGTVELTRRRLNRSPGRQAAGQPNHSLSLSICSRSWSADLDKARGASSASLASSGATNKFLSCSEIGFAQAACSNGSCICLVLLQDNGCGLQSKIAWTR